MNIMTKPEPRPAKTNWHYDSYYLSILARLDGNISNYDKLQRQISPQSDQPDHALTSVINAEARKADIDRQAVMQKMHALAKSIGVYLKISEFHDTSHS
ncbi:MAG: hypothetical protein ACU836_13640 [Gammaproteobacteria bacterium]